MQTKILRQYYVLSFLFSTIGMQIISAVYVTYLMNNGLNLLQVNLVNSVFFVTLFICEIPTGAFADIFGRKTSFVISAVLVSLSMFVYGKSHSFAGFISAEVIAAIGMTFRSGAFQAWLVDSLKHHGYEGSYNKIFGRGNLANQIGGGIGAILGSYLAAKNASLPWFVGSAGMMLVSVIAYLTMQEEYFVRGTFSWRKGFDSMKSIAVSSIRYGTEHKPVRFILIVTFVQIYAVQALNMYWQPMFKSLNVSEKHLGFVFTGITLSLALGAFLASKMDFEGKERKIILLSMTLVGVMVIGAASSTVLLPLIVLFYLHEAGRGFWVPVKDSYLQQRIPSAERATITSFCSIAPHIGGAIGLAVSGAISQVFGIRVGWAVGGVVLILGAFALRKNGSE